MRRLLVLLAAVMLTVLPSAAEEQLKERPKNEQPAVSAEPTAEPTEGPTAEPDGGSADTAEATAAPVTYRGYVYVQYNGRFQLYGLAQTPDDSYEVTITQTTAAGEECTNVLKITDQGVYMESANCENQDCVGMGYVTLDDPGIFYGMIVCLPHQVYVQLYTPEDFQAWYESYRNGQSQ